MGNQKSCYAVDTKAVTLTHTKCFHKCQFHCQRLISSCHLKFKKKTRIAIKPHATMYVLC